MRKIISLVFTVCLLGTALSGCRAGSSAGTESLPVSSTAAETTETQSETLLDAIDPDADTIDLTKLSSTMVYSEVFNMMQEPENYEGKTIVMKGTYRTSYSEETEKYYHFVVIEDATACCQQGMEFILNGSASYPADGTPVIVSGTFKNYEELDNLYYYVDSSDIQTPPANS